MNDQISSAGQIHPITLRHIRMFEEKVTMCGEIFCRDTLRQMLYELSKKLPNTKSGDINSISKIRKIINKETNLDGNANSQDSRTLQYFRWFIDTYEYLKEIKFSFEDKIYNPLIGYFNVIDDNSERGSAHGYKDDSAYFGSRHESSSGVDEDISDTESIIASEIEARNNNSRNAILLLSREFQDIASIYDYSDLENISKRLTYMKQRLDYLLDEEGEINPDLFSLDSQPQEDAEKNNSSSTKNFLRLIPDILLKCQKAAQLSKQWLAADQRKTNDLNEKLDKINKIHKEMKEKLTLVDETLLKHESELNSQASELQCLLRKEERSNELSADLYASEEEIENLIASLQKAISEKQVLAKKMSMLDKDSEAYTKTRILYQENRLKRYALKREINFQKYKQNVLAGDVDLELSIKPNIIRLTNDVQDKCEKLEQVIEKENIEKARLQNALVPLIEDIVRVQTQIEKQRAASVAASMITVKSTLHCDMVVMNGPASSRDNSVIDETEESDMLQFSREESEEIVIPTTEEYLEKIKHKARTPSVTGMESTSVVRRTTAPKSDLRKQLPSLIPRYKPGETALTRKRREFNIQAHNVQKS